MVDPFANAAFGGRSASIDQRRVMLFGPLDAGAATKASATMMLLDGTSAEPASLVINSPGGPLSDALVLVDTVALMRAPVTVDVLGRAHGSAGAVVASAPGVRRISPTASLSLRLDPVPVSSARTANELATVAQSVADTRRRLAQLVGSRTGHTIEWVTEQFDCGGLFGPNEAVELHLVDDVR